MRRGGDSSNIPLHPTEMATGTTTRQTQRLTREARQQHFNEGLCFHCHGRGHISKKCPKKNQISNEQHLSREEKQLSPALGNGFGSAHWTGVSLEPAVMLSCVCVSIVPSCLCHELMPSNYALDAE